MPSVSPMVSRSYKVNLLTHSLAYSLTHSYLLTYSLTRSTEEQKSETNDSFFTVLPSSNPNAGVKRKVEETKGKGAAAKKGGNAFAKKK